MPLSNIDTAFFILLIALVGQYITLFAVWNKIERRLSRIEAFVETLLGKNPTRK